MKVFPIVFTCDDKYFKYACTVIASILYNRNKNYFYSFHILSDYISDENKEKSKQWIAEYKNCEIEIHELRIDDSQFYLNSYMSASTYYRFYIPEIFHQYDRVLYLDCDLIVDADISNLLEISIDDELAICCLSPYILSKINQENDKDYPISYFKNTLKMPEPKDYFNAGVLMFNLKKMREKGIQQKLFDALKEIQEPKLQDQDILNSVFSQNGGVKIIDQRYNMTRSYRITMKRLFWNDMKRKLGLLKKESQLYYIYHYVGKTKPWQADGIDSNLFYFYAKKIPFSL